MSIRISVRKHRQNLSDDRSRQQPEQNGKAVILRPNEKHVPRQKQNVVKTVGDEITVTEINKETIKVSVTIMIVAIKKEMVKGTITKEIAITVLIMTVISKGNCVMIRIKITVEIMLEIIRQVRALT